jgi:hypothetical protein
MRSRGAAFDLGVLAGVSRVELDMPGLEPPSRPPCRCTPGQPAPKTYKMAATQEASSHAAFSASASLRMTGCTSAVDP